MRSGPAAARLFPRPRSVWAYTAWLLGLLWLACCEEAGSQLTQSGRVHGVVRDAETGERLKGVSLVFTSDTLLRANGKTTDEGSYTLAIESDTPHGRIEANKSGYEPRVVSVFLDKEDVQIDLKLIPN